jgi:hypothetical protein
LSWFAERARERETLKALESCCDDKEQSSNQIYEQLEKKKSSLTGQKKDVSFTNASDSVRDEQTLAPKFIPGFNVKVVSMVSALLSASGWVINPHISRRTKLTVLHQDATPFSAHS